MISQCQLEINSLSLYAMLSYDRTRYFEWMRNQGQFIVKMILANAPIRDIRTAYQLNKASNDDV